MPKNNYTQFSQGQYNLNQSVAYHLLPNFFFQVVKVADFGVARVKAQTGVMTAETGTYRWMAPEVCPQLETNLKCLNWEENTVYYGA